MPSLPPRHPPPARPPLAPTAGAFSHCGKGVVAPGTGVFVSIADAATTGVRILGTDLKGVATPVALARAADPKAIAIK